MRSRELPCGRVLLAAAALQNPHTRARWIAFRRWVAGFEGGRFRLLGTPERSWDWPHVELADAPLGFRSVEALLEAARR